MALTFQSDDWLYLKKECEDYLAKYRQELEQSSTSYISTIEARAKVQLLKTLLKLPETVRNFPQSKG